MALHNAMASKMATRNQLGTFHRSNGRAFGLTAEAWRC